MPRPWEKIDAVETPEGVLELRRRGERDFMILVGARVLMTSMLTTSERALSELGCRDLRTKTAPKILIGGLGLGFTLRAALDLLPSNASVDVAELNPIVADWCRGPAAAATGGAANDPRVRVLVGDVTEIVRAGKASYDAILWDLYVGPSHEDGDRDPLYGTATLKATKDALKDGGTFAVWGESPTPAFVDRLTRTGFSVETVKTRGAGLHHMVFVARRKTKK